MSFTLCVLGSGSKGNSIYLRSGRTSLLIDAGLSARQTGLRLASIGVRLEDIDALLITHEHRDHIAGARVLAKRYCLPVYLNRSTWQAAYPWLEREGKNELFENGIPFQLGNLTVEAFSLSHDAADPVGFVIHNGEGKVAIATDLGYATNLVKEKLKDTQLMVLEANHDLEMLKNGPYPWVVKQRVWGRQGHLSNEDSAGLLRELYHSHLQHVVLAHVSEVNNQEHLIWRMTREVLAECALHEVSCYIAKQREAGPQICLA